MSPTLPLRTGRRAAIGLLLTGAFVLGTTLGPSIVAAASTGLSNVLVKNTPTQPVPGVPGVPAGAFSKVVGTKDPGSFVVLSSSTAGARWAITNLIVRAAGQGALFVQAGPSTNGTDCSGIGIAADGSDITDVTTLAIPGGDTVVVPLTQPIVTPVQAGMACVVATATSGMDVTVVGYTLP